MQACENQVREDEPCCIGHLFAEVKIWQTALGQFITPDQQHKLLGPENIVNIAIHWINFEGCKSSLHTALNASLHHGSQLLDCKTWASWHVWHPMEVIIKGSIPQGFEENSVSIFSSTTLPITCFTDT